MKKIAIFIMALFALSGCEEENRHPISSGYTANGYNIEYLFDQDGCKMYRTYSKGNWVHFMTCPFSRASTSEMKNCGKNCYREDVVNTQ